MLPYCNLTSKIQLFKQAPSYLFKDFKTPAIIEKEKLIGENLLTGDTVNNNITRDATNFRDGTKFRYAKEPNSQHRRRWEKDEERRSIIWSGPEILWCETNVTSL